MDRTPLLVISGNEASKYFSPPHEGLRVQGVQGFDSSALVKDCTKASGRLRGPENIVSILDEWYADAIESPQGPVWLDISKDMQSAA